MTNADDAAHARDIISRCDAVIAAMAQFPAALRTNPRITLVLARPAGRGRTMRLLGRSGPRGEVLAENSDGHAVCSFDPQEVKLALEAALAETAS